MCPRTPPHVSVGVSRIGRIKLRWVSRESSPYSLLWTSGTVPLYRMGIGSTVGVRPL